MHTEVVRSGGIVVASSLLLAATAHAAPPSLNLAAALADTKAILQSGGQADIVVLGDSLSFRPGSYLPTFRNLLQSRYGNAGAGFQGMSFWTGAAFSPGWQTATINTDVAPYRSVDGLWTQYDGQTPWPNQSYVTPQDRKLQLQYVTQPGGGSFMVRSGLDGAVVTTISTDGPADTVRTFDYTVPAEHTRYTLQPVGDGPFTVLGQNNLRDTPGVRVHRGANGGWGVENFLRRDSTFDQQLDAFGTDLVMLWIGQNDQSHTRESYAGKISALVERVQDAAPSAEIVLVGTYDSGSPQIAPLVDAMADVADARGLGFINVFDTAGDYATFISNGWLDDGVHFSPAGGEYLGRLLFDAFETDGASLVPEPNAVALVGLAAGALLRRRRA
jgi:lysophospholipase L1-like esterase